MKETYSSFEVEELRTKLLQALSLAQKISPQNMYQKDVLVLTLEELGNNYANDKPQLAIEQYNRVVELCETVCPENKESALRDIRGLYVEQKKWDEAIKTQKRICSLPFCGANDVQFLSSLYFEKKDYSEADRLQLAAIQLIRKKSDTDTSELEEALAERQKILLASNRKKEAQKVEEELNNLHLAKKQSVKSRSTEMENQIEAQIKGIEEKEGKQSPKLISLLTVLASIRYRTNHDSDAVEPLFRRSIELAKALPEKDRLMNMSSTVSCYARFLNERNRPQEAQEIRALFSKESLPLCKMMGN